MAIRLLTCLLLLFSKKGESKCVFPSESTVLCDNIEELYQNYNFQYYVGITGPETLTNLKPLNIVPTKSAKDIKILTIKQAINSLNDSAFDNFSKLTHLHLSNNKITKIPSAVFQNLKLENLGIDNCSVEILSPGAFTKLQNLQELRVTNNAIREIHEEVFTDLPIHSLILDHNKISKIDSLAFANLLNLRKLSLKNNALTKIFLPDLVSYPQKLEELHLDHNRLTEITNYMLEGVVNLKILDLGYNSIETIEPRTFDHTPKLNTLLLHYNDIKWIHGDVLPTVGLHKLQILTLDYNRLMFLSSSFIHRLTDLRIISIGGNPWQCECLNLVLKWISDNKVELMRRDKEFFKGLRPVCVVGDRNECVYAYRTNLYQLYKAKIVDYL